MNDFVTICNLCWWVWNQGHPPEEIYIGGDRETGLVALRPMR
jgi:hypothetical protein